MQITYGGKRHIEARQDATLGRATGTTSESIESPSDFPSEKDGKGDLVFQESTLKSPDQASVFDALGVRPC